MAEDDAGTTSTDDNGGSTTATADAPILNADLTFSEGWREKLPDEIKAEPSLATFKDLPSLAKSFVLTKRMVGKDKIAVPGETSTEQEWNAVYDALGRPKTPDDYAFKKPDELPEEYWDQPILKEAQALFHKIGLTDKQAQAVMAFNNGNVLAGIKNMAAQQEAEMKQLTDTLHAEWGRAYEQKLHYGNMALERATGGNAELKARVSERFGNDPDFIRIMGNLGGMFAEHGVAGASVPTPNDLQTKINTLMQGPAYMNVAHPEHQATVDAVQALFKKKRDDTAV